MLNALIEREFHQGRQFDKRTLCNDPIGFVDRYNLRDANQYGYGIGKSSPRGYWGVCRSVDRLADTWNCLRVGVEGKC
jgi:hypothetical protein